MQSTTTIDLDVAKSVFQVHGCNRPSGYLGYEPLEHGCRVCDARPVQKSGQKMRRTLLAVRQSLFNGDRNFL
jgi:hypothetical protein